MAKTIDEVAKSLEIIDLETMLDFLFPISFILFVLLVACVFNVKEARKERKKSNGKLTASDVGFIAFIIAFWFH